MKAKKSKLRNRFVATPVNNQWGKKNNHRWWKNTGMLDLCLAFVGLEWNLENSVAQGVSIQTLYGHQGLVVICHGDEAEAFAFVGLKIPNHLHGLDRTEWSKELPQKILFRIRSQIVDEDAPPRSIHGISSKQWIS